MKKLFNTMGMTLFFVLILSSLIFAAEELVITTYYPSPYGSYKELRAQRMAIGNTYYSRNTVCWDPPCPSGSANPNLYGATSLVVEDRVGIGVTQPVYKLDVRTYSPGDAIYGSSSSGTGVTGTGNINGVYGYSYTTGSTGNGNGVLGVSYTSDFAGGVFGYNYAGGIGTVGVSDNGHGLQGVGGTVGVSGCNGTGTWCTGFTGTGVFGDGLTYGVYGINRSGGGYGVYGMNSAGGEGVHGESTSGDAVKGESTSGVGVHGVSESDDGVYGEGDYGVHGVGTTWGGYFDGDVTTTGDYWIGAGAQGQSGSIDYVKWVDCGCGGIPISCTCSYGTGTITFTGGIITDYN